MVLKSGASILKAIEKDSARVRKAMGTAVKVEAFRFRKEGAEDLKKGQLEMKPLSVLQKKGGKKARARKAKAPMKSFARGIIYKFNKENLTARIGFIGTKPGAAWQARIAGKSIPGYQMLYKPGQIEKLHAAGIHLRKGTTSAHVPARDIIGRMKEKHGVIALRNIKSNFERKLRGERI